MFKARKARVKGGRWSQPKEQKLLWSVRTKGLKMKPLKRN